MERFGEFLVQRDIITSAQLTDALELRGRSSRNLSLLAIGEKFLTEEEMELIRAHRLETGRGFEDALRELGILSDERLRELREVELFQSLPTEVLEKMARRGRLRTLSAGEIIYREGAPADTVYLVETGLIRLSYGPPEDSLELGTVRRWSF